MVSLGEPGGDGRRGRRDQRAPRGHHVQGQGRARPGRSTSRRCARSARPCPTPTSTSTPTAAGATTTPCARATRSIELGVRAIEEPISVDDRAGRLRLAERWAVPLGGDESCISLAHVDRALEEGAVRVVSIKTARTGFTESRRILDLCLARNVPVVDRQPVRGRDRRDGDDHLRRRVRRDRRPAGRDHELPRPRGRPRRRRRPRSATAARRCRARRASASRSTRSACSATGWTADAVPGRDGGPPPARHAGGAGGRAQGARARVLAGARSATGAGRTCGGWPAATRT